MKCISAVMLLLASLFSSAQSGSLIAIKAGKLIDTENGRVLSGQIILISGDTIQAVGGNLTIPANARIIDLSGATVLPGLIDCHTHMTGQAGENYYDEIFRQSPMDHAIVAHLYAKRTLEAGFTTCRDLGASAFVDVALKKAINRGLIDGPRLIVATLFIGSTGSHGDINNFSPFLDWKLPEEMRGIANGVEGVRRQVRFNIKYGADVIKFGASAGVMSEEESVGAPQFSQEEMNAIVEEARLWGKKACAHAHGTVAIKMAVRAGVASIEHGSILDDEAIAMMKQKGTYLVSDIYNDEYILSEYKRLGYPDNILDKERKIGQLQRESFHKAVLAGVKIAFGTDAGIFPHGWNARQFKWMVQFGMTPMQAIQAATINAADLLGWRNKIGSIASGKYADIVAVDSNPLDDVKILEKISFVMKGGVVIKSMSTEKK